MNHPDDMRVQKMLEVLSLLQLESRQMEAAEDYLVEEQGEEALLKLTFKDLSTVSEQDAQSFQRLFRELEGKGRTKEFQRLFDIIFSVGQSTCFGLFPSDMLTYSDCKAASIAPEKLTAVMASLMGNSFYMLNEHQLNRLINKANSKPDILKQAEAYQKGEYDNGRLILFAVYFYIKYRSIKGVQVSADAVLMEDREMLRQYEDTIIGSIENLYSKGLSKGECGLITSYINEAGNLPVPREVSQISASHTLSEFLIILLGGSAFLNFKLSVRLVKFLKVCVNADLYKTMMAMERFDLRHDLGLQSGSFNEIFGIDTKKFILWAAGKGHKRILEAQSAANPVIYIQCLEEVDAAGALEMLVAIKSSHKTLYERLCGQGKNPMLEKLIKVVVSDKQAGYDEISGYLRGEKPVTVLYPYADSIAAEANNVAGESSILERYSKLNEDDEFIRRCQILSIMKKSSYIFYNRLVVRGAYDKERTLRVFEGFKQEGLAIRYQLSCVEMIYDYCYSDSMKASLLKIIEPVFLGYLDDRMEETMEAFQGAGATGRFIGIKILSLSPEKYRAELFGFSKDSSKLVKDELISVIEKQPDWEEDVLQLLKSKKSVEREIAVRLLGVWNNPLHKEALEQALTVEKSSKLSALLKALLNQEDEGKDGSPVAAADFIKELHKGGKKRVLAWAYETPFPIVHDLKGGEAEEAYLQAVLLCYASMNIPGVNPDVLRLIKNLSVPELEGYVNTLFDKWIDAGAESKKKWVLYAAAVHGGGEIVQKLLHYINLWPQNARGAIAAEAVKALALNPTPTALLSVDGISRKFKFKQIKAAAGEALEFAASQLGLSKEELADKIVPDLGFNERLERIFDYGERKFKVLIAPSLEIEIFDEQDKQIKNMPAPGKRDDAVMAEAAYTEFKLMKKQMKTTVSNQKLRLEQALSAERKWSIEAWKSLFVKNPIMHQFAISLIWGVYEEKELIQTFRYMEDGTFNTEEEDEYELPERGFIGLVHPLELSEDSKEAWLSQLEDYEVTQSVDQLKRQIYSLTEEEIGKKQLERFGGCIINDLSLAGKLQSLDWYRGSVQDAGGFYTYYREDPSVGMGVELHFSGSFIGGQNDDVTVYGARFYKAGTVKRGSYVYEEADLNKTIVLEEVPPRYFSEIVYQLTKATAASKERDENFSFSKISK